MINLKYFIKENYGEIELGLDGKKMKQFDLEELAIYNGKNGSPAYVSYEGKVYDVSNSSLWENGEHLGLHEAGEDLNQAMDEAPHAADLLENFPIVGLLNK